MLLIIATLDSPAVASHAMKLPKPRFTVRRLMVAVAIAATTLGMAQWMARRASRFGQLASDYCHQAELNEQMWAVGNRTYPLDVWAGHQRRLQHKYEHAARRPWLPVAPDPPEPE
jgi:hypothetical protein